MEGGAFIFVTFARCETRSHVADSQNGKFADLALINKLFDSLMIPGVAEIQIDGRKTTGFLGDVYYFPFFVYGV